MSVKATLARILFGTLLFFGPGQAVARPDDSPATIPYRTVAELVEKVQSLRSVERLEIPVRITPKDASDTRPVRLVLKSKSGDRDLETGADRELVRFPLGPELKEENPSIVADRPKGSLQLGIHVSIRRPKTSAEETVGWYQEGLDQANAAAKKLGGGLGFLLPKSKALLVEFPKEAKGRVIVTSGEVDTVIEPDSSGRIGVPLSNYSKKARIRFEPAPTSIQPD